MTKIAKIKQGGFIKKGRVLVTTIKKNGEEGESRVYTTSGKVKIEPMDGKYLLDFTSISGGSFGATSRGTTSGRVYTRRQSIVVDSYEEVEE